MHSVFIVRKLLNHSYFAKNANGYVVTPVEN
jgi:hypothetical protein